MNIDPSRLSHYGSVCNSERRENKLLVKTIFLIQASFVNTQSSSCFLDALCVVEKRPRKKKRTSVTSINYKCTVITLSEKLNKKEFNVAPLNTFCFAAPLKRAFVMLKQTYLWLEKRDVSIKFPLFPGTFSLRQPLKIVYVLGDLTQKRRKLKQKLCV